MTGAGVPRPARAIPCSRLAVVTAFVLLALGFGASAAVRADQGLVGTGTRVPRAVADPRAPTDRPTCIAPGPDGGRGPGGIRDQGRRERSNVRPRTRRSRAITLPRVFVLPLARPARCRLPDREIRTALGFGRGARLGVELTADSAPTTWLGSSARVRDRVVRLVMSMSSSVCLKLTPASMAVPFPSAEVVARWSR